jgi:hypothetical protein
VPAAQARARGEPGSTRDVPCPEPGQRREYAEWIAGAKTRRPATGGSARRSSGRRRQAAQLEVRRRRAQVRSRAGSRGRSRHDAWSVGSTFERDIGYSCGRRRRSGCSSRTTGFDYTTMTISDDPSNRPSSAAQHRRRSGRLARWPMSCASLPLPRAEDFRSAAGAAPLVRGGAAGGHHDGGRPVTRGCASRSRSPPDRLGGARAAGDSALREGEGRACAMAAIWSPRLICDTSGPLRRP